MVAALVLAFCERLPNVPNAGRAGFLFGYIQELPDPSLPGIGDGSPSNRRPAKQKIPIYSKLVSTFQRIRVRSTNS